ncbi:MAG TPA: hypothetical protein VID47_17225 [Actinomycetota bacterium]
MGVVRGGRRLFGVLVVCVLGMTACGSSAPPAPTPVVSGILGFDQRAALADNSVGSGTIQKADPFFACGSTTATYAAEIVTSGIQNAKVRMEWGDVVPGLQTYASGKVTGLAFGTTGDLPFTHPFGADMTFDMALDPSYGPLAQVTGDASFNGIPPGTLHTEIAEGLIPHGADGTYLPGFTPKEGDQAAAYGSWIVDCGHNDFHTEIHPPSVLAFAHQDGSKTVSNVFSDPYVVTQLFNPDPSKAADFADTSRFTDPTTQYFPKYVEDLILGMLGQGDPAYQGKDELQSHTLINVNTRIQDVSWYVCAPGPKPSNGTLSVTSNITTRPGVDVSVSRDDDLGCARLTATIGSKYTPAPITRKDCVLDWAQLNTQAALALMQPGLDVRAAIDKLVPASIVDKVNRSPIVDCYDPLVAPPPGTSGTTVVNDRQPYPFYGTVVVSWK